jgi:D-threo-aldose 1-dehydrogenase
MLPTRELAGTGVATTVVGFGCAGLFRAPRRSVRRLTLDAAYDSGIRHYDVAPMYGLGLAEAELASFLKGRRAEVTITTKFGIDPTLLSKGVARVQWPARALLARRPAVGEELKAAGQGPRSGTVGRLLYSAPGYDRRSAQLGLERSLRELHTDYIDVFLLHDPVGNLITGAQSLIEYLEDQRQLGRIRSWGLTGPGSKLPGLAKSLGRAPVAQFRDDILGRPLADQSLPEGGRITYGALSRALPLMRRFLSQSPDSGRTWSDRVGADLTTEAILPTLLLSAALWRNPAGLVLFTTTRPERVPVAAAAAAAAQDGNMSGAGLSVLSELAAAATRTAGAELIGAP